ncbi:Uma2 family endonuclease [Nostoc sp. UHCC 0302]|uniref:Uma2 family endonuclease n=1 Tax=Nostoc sp. UHCC 0302 TaxID=3134896 RepID=UPI00311CD2DD
MDTVVLNLDPIVHLTDEQFYQLCMANKDLNLEQSATGELIIVPPVGGESGNQEANLITDLNIWNRQTKLGIVFSSSTIFRLPNGAKRSPDAAWVKLERWEALTAEERKKFPPLTPDFVIELRSQSDRLKPLQDKMQEYLENGLRLGWLINSQDTQVEIYRPGQPVEVIQTPALFSGEEVLPGFELQL